jgi:allantoinase
MTSLVIRNATLPTGTKGDIVVHDERIAEIATRHRKDADLEIDASGLLAFPGFVDTHVHLNEPGREDWEGLDTGTRALAAGGVTTFLDMPLNSSPPVLDATQLEAKRKAAHAKSHIDFGLYGGIAGDDAEEIPALAAAGAAAIKAFLCDSGLPDFPATTRRALERAAHHCASHRLVLAVHAESPEELARIAADSPPTGTSWRDYAASRPESVEVEAVRMALAAAATAGCRLHIVHVSAPAALDLVREARRRGVDVTAECCPHHLLLDESAMESAGATAKCSPPLRPPSTIALLWRHLADGHVHTIGSDHSPAPPSMKQDPDFFKIWGGIAGAQHSFPLFVEAALARGIPPATIATLTSITPARRFGLARKNGLSPGAHADIVLLAHTPAEPITPASLLTRHPLSAYSGRQSSLQVHTTILRGRPLDPRSDTTPAGQEITRHP